MSGSSVQRLVPAAIQWQVFVIIFSLYLDCGFCAQEAVLYKVNQEDTTWHCSSEQSLQQISTIEYLTKSNQGILPCSCTFYNPQVTNTTDSINATSSSYVTVKQETCISGHCSWSAKGAYSLEMWTDSWSVSVQNSGMNKSEGPILSSEVFTQEYNTPAILTLSPHGITFNLRCGPPLSSTPGTIDKDPNTTTLPSTTPASTVLLAIMLSIGICFFLGIIILLLFIAWRRRRKSKGSHGQNDYTDNVRVNSYNNVIQAYGTDQSACNKDMNFNDSNNPPQYAENNGGSLPSLDTFDETATPDTSDDFLEFQTPYITNTKQEEIERVPYHSGKDSNITDTRPRQYTVNNSDDTHIQHQRYDNNQTQFDPTTHNSRKQTTTGVQQSSSSQMSKWGNTAIDTNCHEYQEPVITRHQRPAMYSQSSTASDHPNTMSLVTPIQNTHNIKTQVHVSHEYEKPSIDFPQIPTGYGTLRASKSVEEDQGPQYANVWVTKTRTRARSFNSSDKPSHYADIDIAKLKKKQPSIRYTYTEDENKPLTYAELDLATKAKSHSRSSPHSKQVKLTPEEVAELYAVPVKIKKKPSTKESSSIKQGGSGPEQSSSYHQASTGKVSRLDSLQDGDDTRVRNKHRRQAEHVKEPASYHDQRGNTGKHNGDMGRRQVQSRERSGPRNEQNYLYQTQEVVDGERDVRQLYDRSGRQPEQNVRPKTNRDIGMVQRQYNVWQNYSNDFNRPDTQSYIKEQWHKDAPKPYKKHLVTPTDLSQIQLEKPQVPAYAMYI